MKRKNLLSLTALAISAAALPQAASAQSWNAYSTFNSGPTNTATTASPWIYGQRAGAGCAGASSASAFAYGPNAPSGSGFVGWQGVNTPVIVPLVGKNPNGSQVVYSTAQIPANSVWLHPGETGVNPVCAAIRFKAPMAGKFRVKGFIQSIDTGANKVNGYIFANDVLVAGPIVLSGPMGTQVAFDKVVTLVGNPRNIDFAIDDGGSYYNDSTRLDLTITRCPPKGKDDPRGNANNDSECEVRGDAAVDAGGGGSTATEGGSNLPVLNCSQSQNNPPLVNLSTGQPGWALTLPNGAAGSIVPTPSMVPSPWTAVPGAQWVGPQGAPQIPGTYVYETKVRVLKCPNGKPAKITAQFRADNRGTLSLIDPAGSAVTTMNQGGTPNYGFLPGSLSPSSAPGVHSWTASANGIYTVRMTVQNSGGPTGVAANVTLTR